MIAEIIYPAKLLLFGEYSILLGSSALSMPFSSFGASLQFMKREGTDSVEAAESNHHLQKLCDHFLKSPEVFSEFLNLDRFSNDLINGLYLSSTIPQCYGMGSSGALCAAIYSRYGVKVTNPSSGQSGENLILLRQMFTMMESFFHGKSSGFDPLVSYLKKPLLLGNDGVAMLVDLPLHLFNESQIELILIDSGLPCKTGPLVRDFLDRFAPGGEIATSGINLISMTNSCIETLVQRDIVGFGDEINRLSHFQFAELNHLIPIHLRTSWYDGLQCGLFSMKLCGSGGGGYLVCFTRDKKETVKYFKNKMIPVLHVFS